MNIVILATGKCRNAHILALEAEYLSRLPKTWKVSVKELAEPERQKAAEEVQIAALRDFTGPVIRVVLDEKGQQVASRELAAKMKGWQDQGCRTLVFLIGGFAGAGEAVKAEADWVWSLGRTTMPHQLVRAVLAEQVYRAQTIMSGHPYHRE